MEIVVLARSVYPLHAPGGMERAVYEQLRHLAARGLGLTLITQPPTVAPAASGGSLDERIACLYVRYGDLPLRRNSIVDRLVNYPRFVDRVGRQLGTMDLAGQLVHAHGLLAAAGPPDRPLVYAPHGLEEFSRADWRKWLLYTPLRARLRRVASRADAILATDAVMAPSVATSLRVEPDRVRVVPNGISVAGLDRLVDPVRRAALNERLGLAGAGLRLVTCSRLEQNKGLHVAVAALAEISDRLPDGWRWWIVGSGQEERSLRQQISAAGLDRQIHLLGRLDDDDLHNLLPQMDLYLMPSLYEGSSLATLEAMAHLLPVLATRTGGLPDKVLPGRSGYLVPPGDRAALASTLVTAVGERERWPAYGVVGRRLVEQQFDWPAIAGQLEALYQELLSRGPRSYRAYD